MRGDRQERTLSAIGRRLKATREALGLNQRQLCQRASVATNTYNQWEKGKSRPELDEAIKLVDEFDLTLDWIYLGDAGRMPFEIVEAVRRSAEA